MGIRLSIFSLIWGLLLLASLRPACASPAYVRFNIAVNGSNVGYMDVELFQDIAPMNVANFLSYVNSGAYNNLIINRSVPGFVFQAGEITLSGTSIGTNTPGNPVTGESVLTVTGAHSNTRGTIAFALQKNVNTGLTDPNSGTNQWFFNEVDNNSASSPANLDAEGFTAFGIIMNASSLSLMDQISSVTPSDQSAFFNALFGLSATNAFGVDYFSEIPLVNYTSPDDPGLQNIIVVTSITTLTVQTLADWQTGANSPFTSTQQSNPAFIAPAATPFNDGVPNLLKYVCDINPSVPMTGAAIARLPVEGSTTISGSQYMTLTYHQHNALIGVNVNVQTSPDMITWTTVSNPTIVQTGTDSTGDPIEQVRVPATGTQQFIRLNVVQP